MRKNGEFMIVAALFSAFFFLAGTGLSQDGQVSVTISTEDYTIQREAGHDLLSVEDFGRIGVPGVPMLPSRIFAIAVPPGASVASVTFDKGQAVALEGSFDLPPVALPRVIEGEKPELYAQDLAEYEAAYDAVYGSDAPFPKTVGEFVGRAGYRKYNLVDVRVTPFAYLPQSKRLIHYPEVKVNVAYTVPEELPALVHDNLERTEAAAKRIVCNYDQARQWYLGGQKSRGLYDYVIITLPTLTSTVQPLVDWETVKGRNVNVVTTTWINSNYSGYDLAEKMRNFLRDKYPSGEWGIEDVCLVGHYDDVPMRRGWQDEGYGKPETDYYYAELSLPDSESWDLDGDHKWGELTDPIDMYAEVNVGRIPWSGTSTVSKIVAKSVAFENNHDPAFKKNMLLLGAFFWPNTDNAVLMEYKSDADKHPWMSSWTTTKMYEVGYSNYPCDKNLTSTNVKNTWGGGKYSFVNWGGHGNPTGCYLYYGSGSFVNTNTCNSLNDDYPAVIFAAACSNSDTDYTNLGQKMLERGGVGFVGATKVAYGTMGWSGPNNGSCQSMDYFFTTCVTSGDYTIGGGHQEALRRMYWYGHWYKSKYEMFEWGALFGQPDLGFGKAAGIHMNLVDGMPLEHEFPGTQTRLTLEIRDGLENYVAGSGSLHYRFDPNDSYTAVSLVPIGGDLYEGVIPNTKPGDEPQFYLSAKGDGGATVSLPASAPSQSYGFELYFEALSWEDDFETDQGWVVESDSIVNGEWERAEPEFTFIQPGSDHTPDGTLCFVTDKRGGVPYEYDVDGGPTRLTSPTIDLDGADARFEFYLWFYHTADGDPYPFEIDLSNDDGATWVNAVSISPMLGATWMPRMLRVSDHIAPSSEMKIRFTVSDNPDDDVVEACIDDFSVTRIITQPALWSDCYEISTAAGGVIDFSIDAGPGNANRNFLLLGSLTGTSPGFVLPGGEVLPLNWDVFTDLIMVLLGSPVFQNFMGTLDGSGTAAATLDTFGPVDPILIGQTAHFAYLLGFPPGYDFTSNAVPVTFEP